MKAKTDKTPVVMLSILAAGCFLFIAIQGMSQKVSLAEGWNLATYKGKEQTAADAFASIIDYLVIAYYWDGEGWQQVTGDTMMVPGGEYNIQVSQDCTWAF